MLPKAFRCSFRVGIIALIFSSAVRADLLSAPLCATCFGSTYLLTYNPTPVVNGSVNTYDVKLTINTGGYSLGSGDWIKSVSIKLANSVEPAGPLPGQSSLDLAPLGGTWSLQVGGQNSKGCSGTGAGFLCAQDGTSAVVGPGRIYVWELDYATTEVLLTGHLQSSVKADYYHWTTPQTTPKNPHPSPVETLRAQTSEAITIQTVPDGSVTGMLLGGALVGLETLRRKLRA